MNRAMQPQDHRSPPNPRTGASGPMLAWGLVLALAMLSFFVHLVSDHMARAQQHQQLNGAAASRAVQTAPVLPEARVVPVLAVMR